MEDEEQWEVKRVATNVYEPSEIILPRGWEPFAVTMEGSTFWVWLRR